MNRRKFAFSWGRKIFFGISWPLSLLLSLIYLRSFIFPQTFSEGVYYLLTWIGHLGLLNAAVYFLLYCPITFLMPTYYVTRFWSLLLILGLNLFILLDALSYTTFSYHLYSFLGELLIQEGVHHLLGSSVFLWILGIGILVLSGLIWLRGEVIWRYMQARFSNPVSNWYLVMIVLCVLVSRLLYHSASVHPALTENFPLNLHFSEKTAVDDNRKFFYPSDKLVCPLRNNPNIVFILLDELSAERFTPEMMPSSYHMKGHGTHFANHLNVSSSTEEGRFSFFYSIPSSYRLTARNTQPAILKELASRNYRMAEFGGSNDLSTIDSFRQWITNLSGDENGSFYLSFRIREQGVAADSIIHSIILELQKNDLLLNTHVILTSAWAGEGSSKIPLIWMSPDRKSREITHATSPYDVIPSLMENFWGCKKVFKLASTGEHLEKQEHDWVLFSLPDGFGISDIANNGVTEVRNGKIIEAGIGARRELIFSALKKMNYFTRPN